MENYVLYSPESAIFWQKTKNYGFNFQNQQVFEAVCTEELDLATALSEEEATKIASQLKKMDFCISGKLERVKKKPCEFKVVKISELR